MAHTRDEASPADIQKYLHGVQYPASKADLVAAARGHKAPDDVIRILERLPADRFEGPPGVMKAYGEIR